LDGVYVDTSVCTAGPDGTGCSWGFRDAATGKRYIGLNLWQGSSPAPYFYTAENTVFNYLINYLYGSPIDWGSAGQPYFDSKYSNDPVDTSSAMTVLAALAHELGHVRWYDINVPTPGGGYEWISSPLTQCFFFDKSWKYNFNKPYLQPYKWTNFGELANSLYVKHYMKPETKDLTNAANLSKFSQALASLYGAPEPWPSLLASLTPVEDFVETYVFYALTTAATPLTSLRLNIPYISSQTDVVSDYLGPSKLTLSNKLACIKNIPPYSASVLSKVR
jgi:hypothetical protein